MELDNKQLEGILEGLKRAVSLSPYSLTLYRRHPAPGAGPPRFEACCSLVQAPLCREISQHFFKREMERYFSAGVATACRYGGGFLGFVVPFHLGDAEFCLVADGVRDKRMDLWQVATLSSRGGPEIFSLLPQIETLWTSTFAEVEETAREVARQISRLSRIWQRPMAQPGDRVPSRDAGEPKPAAVPLRPVAKKAADPEDSDPRLHAVAEALEQFDNTRTLAQTIALACETLISNFDLTALAVALRGSGHKSFEVSGICGLPEDLGSFPADAIGIFLSSGTIKKTVPLDPRMRSLLPALRGSICTTFPLQCQDEVLGFIAILDTQLRRGEIMMVSMVAHAAAARLSHIVKDAEQAKASARSGRLMSLANTLLLVENKEELYEAILGIASDLIEASQGSIMLIDKNGKSMSIVCSLGMSLNIAQSLPMRVGRGIAGTVAQTGEPLLVDDVEKDLRVAIINRPRFKSKSLLCVPLKLKDKIIGVLNLSDKKTLSPFTDSDLQLLTSFANLASLMIERSLVLEESIRFEQLSVTDSLTGLYNRRFLKSRLEEELNRSIRQGLNLTLLFIDLDLFKSYNDVCGHIAGDEALKKTAEIIKSSVREMDIVARYGGEEFCAVLPGTSKAEAMHVAERIRREIEAADFTSNGEIPFRRMTASLGVATFPEDGRTYTALVHASDMALYQAKARGRNCIVAAGTPGVPSEPPADEHEESAPDMDELTEEEIQLAKTFDFNAYFEASLRSGE